MNQNITAPLKNDIVRLHLAGGGLRELDKVVQFERLGFVRIDLVGGWGCGVFYAQVKGLIP